jgi:hypothetical protein
MISRILLAGLLLLGLCGAARGSDLDNRQALKARVIKLYRDESFAQLDELFDQARAKSLRTDSGIWQLWVMHRAIIEGERAPATEEQSRQEAARAQRWLVQRPASVVASLVVAETEIRRARALGCGQCRLDAGQDRDALYHASLQRAKALLDAAESRSSVDPQWYADTLDVGRMAQWPRKDMDAAIERAAAAAPGYYTVWFNIVDVLLAQDSRTAPARIDAVARRAMAATHGKEGASMYARIWWYSSQVAFGDSMFETTPVAWKDFDAGIRDVMARYPDDWNRNSFANFACNAGHPERARELMGGHKPLPDAWDSFEAYEDCIGATFDA